MPRKPAWKQTLESYLTKCETRGLSELTIRQYAFKIRQEVRFLEENDLRSNPSTIGEKEIRFLMKNHRSPNNLRILKTFLRKQKNDIFNEMEIVIPQPEPKRTWLSEEEAQVLVAGCQTPKESLIVHLALMLGFRRIEIQRAKLDHFKGDDILIHGKGRAGGKFRGIAKHEDYTNLILNDHLMERQKLLNETWKRSDYLVIHAAKGNLTQYSLSGLDYILRKITKRSDITATYHTLRRSFGRFYYDTTSDIEETANLLGHESIDMTRKYIGTQISKQKKGLARMREKVYLKPISQTTL